MLTETGSAQDTLIGLVWIDGIVFPDPGMAAPGAGIPVATIAWRQAEAMIDSGLPDRLSLILSRALLSQGSVVFIDHFIGYADGARSWRTTPGGSLCSLPLATPWWRFWSRRRPLDIIATDSEAILATLGFAEGGWTLQQQVMLVVPGQTAIDRPDGDLVAGWLGARPRPDHARTFAGGVRLAMAAGHDGEWCIVHAPSADALAALRDALRDICLDAGLRWAEGDGPQDLRFWGIGPWPEDDGD